MSQASASDHPLASVRQRQMIKTVYSVTATPEGGPTEITCHSLGRIPVREPIQGLQHRDRRDDIGQDRWRPTGVEVFNFQIRNQSKPVFGQKAKR